MAEEFQAAICGETWWNMNSTRSVFPLMNSSSTCSVAANDVGNYSSWQTRPFVDEETHHHNFVSDVSMGFLDSQKPQHSESAASGTSSSFLIDSTLQIMGFGLSSPTSSNWNQSLFHCNSGREESNFHSVLQEETCIDSCNNSQIQQLSTNVEAFKPIMEQEFSLDQQSSGLSCGFPIGSDGNSYGYPSNSTLIQSLFDPDPQPQPQPQNSLYTTNHSMLSPPTWSKVSSMPKQQLNGLHFSNNTPFWNASAEALNDIPAGVLTSQQPQYQSTNFQDKKHNSPNKLKREESTDMAKKNSAEPPVKRARIETPSPLPTFKVRKEKLGDRITALQQLVSPFGKTDTASVLHEAIDYIKFLHDQVNVLSTPYMKNGSPTQHQQGYDNGRDTEEEKQDLRRLGLCLVPISSTFPMTNETSVDFWTPTFGGPLFGS